MKDREYPMLGKVQTHIKKQIHIKNKEEIHQGGSAPFFKEMRLWEKKLRN